MKRFIVPFMLGWVSFFFAPACKEFEGIQESRTITVSASFPEDNTRADIEQSSGSRDLITRWKEDDVIRIYLFQDGKGYTLDPVKVYNISNDGKRCSFGFKLPSGISVDHPYDIYGLCDAEGVTVDEEALVLAKSQLKRMPWSGRIVPIWFHSTGGQSSIQASFRHLGTYEILHITNSSNVGIMFGHDGFNVEVPWYKSYESTPLKDDYDPTQNVEEPGDDAHSGSAFVPGHSTKEYLSWYIPSGALISEAKLLATIDGKSIVSANSKNSNVRIQRGHVYHMYATWDGAELKFDKANELLDELGLGFTHLDMYEDGGYGFVTGREGHLKFETTDPSVATAIEDDDIGELHVEIQSHSIGTAIVTITDTNTGEKSQIEVVVKELTNYTLLLDVGETGSVTMKNDKGSFEAFSENESVASCEVRGNQILVTGKKAGETTVQVTDRSLDKHFTISVFVFGETQDNDPEAVDLGLPSGLKWASFNLGATKPEEYGNFYVWGETETKEDFSWMTYKWCMGADNTMIKYCTNSSYGYNGFTDGKTVLEPEDDAAHVNLGGNWRMPTHSEWDELRVKCTWSRTSVNGINGDLVTGPNGNSIFLPAAGDRSDSRFYNVGSFGSYWSSSLDKNASGFAWSEVNGPETFNRYVNFRYGGFSVRPVYDDSEQKPEYKRPEPIDLGLPSGLKWASFNLGASRPEEYGYYYAWGETEYKKGYWAFDWDTYKWCMGTSQTLTKYCSNPLDGYDGFTDGKMVLDLDDDVAHVKLGENWRMPTTSEQGELWRNCTWEWTQLNGVNGCRVTGPNGNSIFFPAAGTHYPVAADEEYRGYYWSSSLKQPNSYHAYYLEFGYYYDYGEITPYVRGEYFTFRCYGASIRPVYDDSPPDNNPGGQPGSDPSEGGNQGGGNNDSSGENDGI